MNPVSSPFDIQTALSLLPEDPGVYRMYGDKDVLLYVGKAKNLKSRVRSYFQNPVNLAPKVFALMQQVKCFDYIVTDTEVEALILEANLIKQFRPKYNILLRDDKKFPWIGLSKEPFPRLFITREPSSGGKFFGPYVNSGNMYRTLQVIRKHFPLRQRKTPLFKNRPCMNYYIGTCSGPCQKLVTQEEYAEIVKQVELFLKGKADDLLEVLEAEMVKASEDLNFELAAKLRDRHAAVQDVLAQQKMYYSDPKVNQDIVAMASDPRRCTVTVLNIRRGKLIGSRSREIPLALESTPEEAYNAFITQFYQDEDPQDLPDEMIVQCPLEDEDVLQRWLSERRGNKHAKKVTITHPQKGLKKNLLELGIKNAQEALEQAQAYESKRHQNDPARALMDLQEALNLPQFPSRMECYDISHFQGSQTVASMVVFTDGIPDRKAYRRFKIQSTEGKPDDFQSMSEVIRRRFGHVGETGWEEPDLMIIDGGKGQLAAALSALKAQGVNDQPIISLAKKFEEIFVPGQSRPVLLPRNAPALFVLQQIRDEAHRFAITYHRNLRGKAATQSMLDHLPGIGKKRKQALLQHFGTFEGVQAASVDELSAVPGLNKATAEKLYTALHSDQ